MTTIALFHSATGLRPAIHDFAEQLRDAGHRVHTPDLFDGRIFDDVAEGAAHRDSIGIPTLIERALAAVEALPQQVAYIGYSMGAGPAQLLAATRPGALGAVLVQGGLTVADLGLAAWPANVDVQLHVGRTDAWFDRDEATRVAASLPATALELYEYDTDKHVFDDHGLKDSYDPILASALHRSILDWLARIDRQRVLQESATSSAVGRSQPVGAQRGQAACC